MGEAAQVFEHISTSSDRLTLTFEEIERDDPERLYVVPVPPPPLPIKPVQKNVSKRSQKVVDISQPVSQPQGLSKCLWCGKPFQGRANRKFCTPSIERKLNFERRQALTVAVAEQFKQRGCSVCTGTLQNVAKKCIDADYEWWLGAMQKLGWKYLEKSCTWIKE